MFGFSRFKNVSKQQSDFYFFFSFSHGTHHIFVLDGDDEVEDLVEFVEGDFPEYIVLDEAEQRHADRFRILLGKLPLSAEVRTATLQAQ